MATPTNVQASMPASAERRPVAFLPLAPTTSDSYPRQRSQSQMIKPLQLTAEPPASAEIEVPVAIRTRRSSSLSSDGNGPKSPRFRFLKLGPVHWGEQSDEVDEVAVS